MSSSPDNAARSGRYESGWLAINRLIREGGSWSGHERNVLYWNLGNGTFADVSAVAGLDLPEDGRAFAAFDFDQDGDLDLIVKNRNSPQLRLLRNDLPGYHHSVAFHLQGTRANRDAVGTRLVLETASRKLLKTVRSGSGFLSQPSRIVYFGLGDETKTKSLTVFWPDGETQKFAGLPVDHLIRLTEGKADFTSMAFRPRSPNNSATGPTTINALASGKQKAEGRKQKAVGSTLNQNLGVWLTEPIPAPRLELSGLDGKAHSLSDYRGHPILLNFWATWCAPCQTELSDLQNRREDISLRGLLPLLVSVDEPGEERKVREFARNKTLTFQVLRGNEDVVRQYSVLLRHLTDQASDLVVPTTFLISSAGEIIKFYLGRASVDQILRDVDQLPTGNDIRSGLLRLALPFSGRAYVADFRRNWIELADAMALAGFSEPALAYLEQAIRTTPGNAEAWDHLGLLHARQGRWEEALSAFRKALELATAGAAVHSHMATALSQLGRLSEAELAAQRGLAAAPEDPEILRLWAAIKSRQGNPEQALPALLRSLTLDPESADGFYNLGLLYQKLGRIADSVAAFRQAIMLDPGHAESLNTLGVISAQEQSPQQAASFFDRALKAKPNFAEAHRNLGLIHVHQGNLKQAEQSFRDALRLQPNYAEALNDLGGVYLKTGRLREALALFQQAQREKPDLVQAYLNAARVYIAVGENHNAVMTLEALLKIHPQEPVATEWLRRLRGQNR